jgi:hypothetical protein
MRLASLILVGTTALVAAAPGKVVRVERARSGRAAVPILCMLQPDGSGICLGASPQTGDEISVVGETRTLARVRVAKVMPFRNAGNVVACDTMWQIAGELVPGSGDLAHGYSKSVGIIDPTLDAHTARFIPEDKLVPPPDLTGNGHGLGIDRDHDGVADILFLATDCDQPATSTRSGECIGVWTRANAQLHRVSLLDLRSCNH